MPDQRCDVLPHARVDLTDEQHVIARGVQRVVAAFQPGDAAFDQRRRRRTQAKRHPVEPVGMRARKPPRQLDLIVGENVHHVTLRALENRQASRP